MSRPIISSPTDTVESLRRKINQAWELAGLARQDGDREDEKRWTDEARSLSKDLGQMIKETGR